MRTFFDTAAANAELLQQVIDKIQTSPSDLNQSVWGTWDSPCGTPACIAGLAVLIDNPQWFAEIAGEEDVGPKAQKLLGLDEEVAVILFSNVWPPEWMSADTTRQNPSHEEVVATLQKVIRGDLPIPRPVQEEEPSDW